MRARKWLKAFTYYGSMVWAFTVVIVIAGMMSEQIPKWVLGLNLCLAFILFLLNATMVEVFKWVGMDKNWFLTQEELHAKTKEVKDQWDHVEKVVRIIGNHEAVKLWKENKNKENEQDREGKEVATEATA